MRNLSDLWTQAVSEFPERTAVVYQDRSYTYAELGALVNAFAAELRARFGVQPGDRVALVMPNCLHSIVCYLGAIRAGAVALPVNVRLKAEEMRFILGDAGATVVVVVHQTVWPTVREAIGGTELAKRVVGVEFDESGVVPVAELLVPAERTEPFPAQPDEVAAIIYTSGTTELPKGALITHANVLSMCSPPSADAASGRATSIR